MGVYMELSNPRTDSPDNFTESDLEKADLHKHILISKVDYLTFQYKGFYALNVINKISTDIYRYAPSVGLFDPYAAYYLVFTEQ